MVFDSRIGNKILEQKWTTTGSYIWSLVVDAETTRARKRTNIIEYGEAVTGMREGNKFAQSKKFSNSDRVKRSCHEINVLSTAESLSSFPDVCQIF